MLRDAGVRGKLFAVLAIPVLLLVITTGWLVGGQVQSARQAGQVEAVTDVAIQVNRVVHSLQQERSVSMAFLQDSSAGQRNSMRGQRQYTDSQLRVLRDKLAASPIASMSQSIRDAAARATAGHNELVGARKSIDAGRFYATETDVFYGKIIATDLQLPGVIAASASPDLAQRLQAYGALSTAIEYAAHERDLVELAYLDGTLNEAQFAQATALVAQQRQSLQDFQRSAPPALYAALDTKLAASDVGQLDKSRRHLTDLLKGRDPDFGGSVDWASAANARITMMVDTEESLVGDIASVASAQQSSEKLTAGLFSAAAIFGLVLALLMAAVLAQRITRPLRRLTDAAGEIGEELPHMVERMQTPGEGPGVIVEPIPVETRDEIGRLAEAFNTVNEVTVRVAKEQAALRASIAEMFVNVARRNQVLLGRQLSELDKMEAREEDPDLLQNLFKLDHLATRMRRNAESLLVLAGIDSTRRLRASLPLSDVIRTAVGEIEAYDRIDLSMSDDPEVSGRHALSIAHLLAELLENATHFSNPGTRVVVATAMTGHGVDVSVTDYGLGMSDEEIEQANENIAHPPVAEIAVSQRLGLFVVGRIAARLGASASLRKGRSAGTIVTVGLPLDVFEGLQVEEPIVDEPFADVLSNESADIVESTERAQVAAVAGVEPTEIDGPDVEAVSAQAQSVEAPAVNHSEVALSRLPRVDVAALAADAAADSSGHTPVGPLDGESGRRRLLPRRSRNGDQVDQTLSADVPVDEAPVDAVAGETPRDELAFAAPVAVVADEVVPDEVVPDEVVAGEDVAVVVPLATEDMDLERPDIAASARRRSAFFQRRRQSPPPADVAAAEPEAVTNEQTSFDGFDDTPVVATEPVLDEPVLDEPVLDEPVVDEAVVDEAVVAHPDHADETLFDVADAINDDTVEAAAAATEADVPVTAPAARPGRRFGRRRGAKPTTNEADSVAPVSEAWLPELAPEDVAELSPEEVAATVAAAADELFVADAVVVDEPLEAPSDVEAPESELSEPVVVDEPRARRRGLFGRSRPAAAEPAVEEPVGDDTVAVDEPAEPVAFEPVFSPVPEEPVAVEPVTFEPVFALAPEEPVAVEPVAVEPVAFEPVFSPVPEEPVALDEPSAVDVVDEVAPIESAVGAELADAELADAELADAELVDAEQIDAEPVEPLARRRGLFGRRRGSAADTAPEQPAAEVTEPDTAPAAADFVVEPAPVVPDSFAAQLPEPVAAPAPEPLPEPVFYSAPAIDILPGKPMGRGKHAAPPVPAPAPVAAYSAPPAPPVPVPVAAQVPVATPPAPAAVPAVAPLPVRELSSVAASAATVSAAAAPSAPPAELSRDQPGQPASSNGLSDLDQLARNAELHKSALSELRGLYEPAFTPTATPVAAVPTGLKRREARPVEEPIADQSDPQAPARTRDASEVRGMLSGFRAGVERGRSADPDAQPGDAVPVEAARSETETD
jgi:signal transduction histidine kinase